MTRRGRSVPRALQVAGTLAILLALASCKTTTTAPLSSLPTNDETYETLSYLWSGVPAAIEAARESPKDTFNLPLTYQLPCPRGGQGSYRGTLSGTKSGGSGTATLVVTATLTDCQFADPTTSEQMEVSVPALAVNGTIAVSDNLWGTFTLHMVAADVTVNGKTCPGGVDVVLTGNAPSAQTVSTGTACGRTGAVPLP